MNSYKKVFKLNIVSSIILSLVFSNTLFASTNNSVPITNLAIILLSEDTVKPDPQIIIAALEKKVAENPSYENYLDLAVAYLNNKMAFRSFAPLNKALVLQPNSPVVYNNLGYAYILMQDFDAGITNCEKAIQLDTSFQLAKNNLNMAIRSKAQLSKSITTMEATPEKDRTAAFYLDLGLNYQHSKQYLKSIVAWDKMLVLDPKNALAYNNIGVSNLLLFKYDDAITNINKSLAINPDSQLAKNNLAWAKEEKKKAGK
jgi:tetratricopeptide (TPR) repeat protein